MKELAIVGMSPGNSYFKQEIIEKLLRFAVSKFSKVRILIADKPAEHTYEAIGYPKNKAQRKARLGSNRFENCSKRSISKIKEENYLVDVDLIDWEAEVSLNKYFLKEYSKIKEMYEKNMIFRYDIRETTRGVLVGKLKEGLNIEEAIDEGVYYLLKELAFLCVSSKIFDVKKVTYIYHNNWKVFENLIEGKYDNKVRKDLGFFLISFS